MAHIGSERDTKLSLIEEIERYLAVVDAFRALAAHPTWASETWGSETRAAEENVEAPSGSAVRTLRPHRCCSSETALKRVESTIGSDEAPTKEVEA